MTLHIARAASQNARSRRLRIEARRLTPASFALPILGPMDTRAPDPHLLAEAIEPSDFDALVIELMARLRSIASGVRRGHAEDSLGTTALVHETYLRLAQQPDVDGSERTRFLGLCATVMRRVLVDRARARLAAKRSSVEVELAEGESVASEDVAADSLLALEEALGRLQAFGPRLVRIVELRVYGGFEHAEIGTLLDVNEKTVRRDWMRAKALLAEWMQEAGR